ncbi:type I polyketide synthase [Amycolatopsis rubida]|uniref:Type I polyketide synthase n=1 Tax=Amycolatopsis rubida TaxID=112413 RepID=A0ABX0BXE3_9PSEU|nr:type I polyketide synthase [Amycolatopsis rubida]NEC58799.1 type I polyketide synthase [Amycolatopsis rubida]OAP23001.1 Phthiocerol/phenolphthiocerol synthesis polyketide synthase type I PpsE [Amycolatopsis sp. M39]
MVAYVVSEAGTRPAANELRRHLGGTLPTHMIPSHYLTLAALPMSPNGKIDRAALPGLADGATAPFTPPDRTAIAALRSIWCALLGVGTVGIDTPFFDAGGTSLMLVRLRFLIRQQLDRDVDIGTLLAAPTIRELAARLAQLAPRDRQEPEAAPSSAQFDIAVVGMAGRFPGADTVEEFWHLLRDCREGISHTGGTGRQPGHVGSAGLLSTGSGFDRHFFGFTPSDADLIDPQQHLFLETAWEAMENAGHAPLGSSAKIGVFGGCGPPHHWLRAVAQAPPSTASEELRSLAGNPLQFLTAHVAHKLRLRGPAVTVHTACSTSLVAVHLACKSLMAGECSMALAGGVSLLPPHADGYVYEEGGTFSSDGRCRPFDASAGGLVPASGVGVVVLRRLTEALADGDDVHAVIRGSGLTNDGARKVGFTAPGVEGQYEAITAAHSSAGFAPDTIDYVQAHGTATALGDLVELKALSRAFRPRADSAARCVLGSVKSNVGHLDSAAGVTGLIATVLALRHQMIPATLHFQRPGPGLDESLFHVNSATIPWRADSTPRRAGVSSFGIGGTNAHVVLEELPARCAPPSSGSPELLLVSARDSASRAITAARLTRALRADRSIPVADAAFTLQAGRAPMTFRRAAVCGEGMDPADAVEGTGEGRFFEDTAAEPEPSVAFVFPGSGNQHAGMGADLYRTEQVYREGIDRCADLFDTVLGCDLRSLLHSTNHTGDRADLACAMAAIVTTEYALAQLLREWGVRPVALLGHSLGEYTAACVSGVISLSDMIELVALRGTLIRDLPAGGMLAVRLSEQDTLPLLGPDLSLAAVNGPRQCVVSGPSDAVHELERRLGQEAAHRRLPGDAALHSSMVEPLMSVLHTAAARVSHDIPEIPIVSGLRGDWLTQAEPIDAGYWARHLRGTVRFSDALTTLLKDPDLTVLEVGPGTSLTKLVGFHPAAGDDRLVLPTLPPPDMRRDSHPVHAAVAQLWCRGVDINWRAGKGGRRRRVALPTYPFDRGGHPRSSPPGHSEPATTISNDPARELARLWCELLGTPAASREDDFFALGGDSNLAIRLRSLIRQRLGIHCPLHTLMAHPTFGDLHDHLLRPPPEAENTSGTDQPLLITLRARRDRSAPSLVLVQSIGGTVYSYRALAERLRSGPGIHALRALGLEPGETACHSVTDIATRYVRELSARGISDPLVLGGHSSGGVIAQEMARQLLDSGAAVPLVVLIDTLPIADSRRLGIDTAEGLLAVLDAFRETAPDTWKAFHNALTLDPAIREVVRATNQAIKEHEPASCSTNLLFLRARERDTVFDPHPETAWAPYFHGDVAVRTVGGNHLTMIESRHVDAIADAVDTCLDTTAHCRFRDPPA